MTEEARFAVIQVDHESWDPMALAKALAAIRETPVQDQVLAAKAAWGIVADDLSESGAQALGKALRARGVGCAVGPTAALVELAPVEAAETLGALPDAAPTLVSVAAITITTTTGGTETKGPGVGQTLANAAIVAGTGIPIKIGGWKRSAERPQQEEDLLFFADLHYRDPSRRLRIDASRFDFSCLQSRMLYQKQGNLKLLIGDVVRAAPKAWKNHGTRVLLEGRPIRTMGYRSLEDLEREARWLLTVRRLRT
jgi:hypothetical protein